MDAILMILGGLVLIVLAIWIQGNVIDHVEKWKIVGWLLDRPKKTSRD